MKGFCAGDVGVQVFEPEGQLIGIEALGPASELTSLKLSDDAPKVFDLVVSGLDENGGAIHPQTPMRQGGQLPRRVVSYPLR